MIAAVPLLWLLWFAEAAKHQQQHHQHHQQIQWDPPQLPPYWWRVESGGDDERPQVGQAGATVPIEVVCASSRTLLRMEGIFGHLNNVLIEYAHLLFDAVTFGPPPGTMLLPRAFSRFVGDRSFNVSAATASWACVGGVGGEAPPSAGLTVRTSFAHGEQRQFSDVVTRNASEVYRGALSGGRSAALLAFERVAIAQLLLRPSQTLRRHVESFERSIRRPWQAEGSGQYVVIHFRAFGPSCHVRITRALKAGMAGRVTRQFMPGGRPVFAADLCGMSDDYIDAALKQRKRAEPRVQSWPVVLCHDGLNDGRAEAIRKKYRAISYAGPMGHYVDLLLTIRAGFFIGNPASSFSHNGARVRYLMRPEDPATTITCEGMHRDPAYC